MKNTVDEKKNNNSNDLIRNIKSYKDMDLNAMILKFNELLKVGMFRNIIIDKQTCEILLYMLKYPKKTYAEIARDNNITTERLIKLLNDGLSYLIKELSIFDTNMFLHYGDVALEQALKRLKDK